MVLFVLLVVRDGKIDFSPVSMDPTTAVPPPVVRVTVAAVSFVSLSYTEAPKEDSPSLFSHRLSRGECSGRYRQ